MTTDPVVESSSAQANGSSSHITEDEASLYDRQIRLWGLEAQNRMRSSTVLVLGLRGVAHETIKNLVLAGIGRLIIMDNESVTEGDLGTGFLFREEEGAVGQERTAAALPQIASLNPLVSLTALPTLSPFISDSSSASSSSSSGSQEEAMISFLQREKVDVVVACDLRLQDLETIDSAVRKTEAVFYGAGSYGFYGYVFADLGPEYNFVVSPLATGTNPSPGLSKKSLSYTALTSSMDRSKWGQKASEGGSPFRGISRQATREATPAPTIALLTLWEFEKRHGSLPTGSDGQREELGTIAEELRVALGVSEKVVPRVEQEIVDHLSAHATHFFPPTLAILGGLLAQDVLRALSKKDLPITNLLVVDSMGGTGCVSRWGMKAASELEHR